MAVLRPLNATFGHGGEIVASWMRPLIVSLLVGSVLTLAVLFIARAQMLFLLDWMGPVFYLPFQGSVLLSGETQEPAPWLYHTILFLQFCVVAFIAGWIVGSYRKREAEA